MEERLAISIPEAAKLIGISKARMYEVARSADFPCIQVGCRKLVSVSGLRAWVKKKSGEERLEQ